MPNGGHPRHMRLKPRLSSDHVVYAEEMRVRVFEVGDWDAHGPGGTPLIDIEGDEALALAQFIVRWAEEDGPDRFGPRQRDVEYDY